MERGKSEIEKRRGKINRGEREMIQRRGKI
jgi:hypothetical protein